MTARGGRGPREAKVVEARDRRKVPKAGESIDDARVKDCKSR